MKLLLFIEDRGAVAQIRLLSPFDLLKRQGLLDYDLFVMDHRQDFEFELLDKYDVFIFQRTDKPETVEIMRQAQLRGKRAVYDIDDNLLNLPVDHPMFKHFRADSVQSAIVSHLKQADLVTVSTAILGSALADYTSKQIVIRNELDPDIFGPALAKAGPPVKIGYAAGWTHKNDLGPVVQALEKLLAEYGEAIRLVFFWLIPDELKGHPQVEHLGGFPLLGDYAQQLQEARLDIGLAPLAENAFNAAKSDVKYLEYASQAIAGIYSRVPPFASVADGQTGLFVDGQNPDRWYEKIKFLIEHQDERRQIQQHAMNEVRNNRSIKQMAEAWGNALQQLISDGMAESIRPLVSIVMLTYNALDYTRECVESIRNNTDYPYEIVFVDNGSTDGTVDYLETLQLNNPHYRVIANENNLGFAAGNNQGAKAARGTYVMLLNNDVLVSRGWLEDLVTALERDPRIGMVGPVTNHISGRQVITDVPYTDTPGFHEFAARVRSAKKGIVTPRRRIAGFAFLMRKDLYDDLGGLEESFGSGNYEDDDLCLRVRERDYAVMVDEGAFIHHYGSRTFNANKIDYNTSMKRNEGLFQKRWPQVDHRWLLEMDEPLVAVHKAMLDQAATLMEQSELESATALCEAVLKENPLSEQAYYGLGLIAYMRDDQALARSSYRAALNRAPNWAPPIRSLAQLDLIENDLAAAKVALVNLLDNEPDDLDARRLLAQVLLKQEHFDEGISLLTSIIESDPRDWQAHLMMAGIYDELDRAEDVVKHCGVVLEVQPEHDEASRLLIKYSKKD